MLNRRDFLKLMGGVGAGLASGRVEARPQKMTLEEAIEKAHAEFISIKYKGGKNYVTMWLDGRRTEFRDFYSFAWRLKKQWGIDDDVSQLYIAMLIDTSLEKRTKGKFKRGMGRIKERPELLRRFKTEKMDDLDLTLQALRFQESGFNINQGVLGGCHTEFQFDKPTYRLTVRYVKNSSTIRYVKRHGKRFDAGDRAAVNVAWDDLIRPENSNRQEGFAKLILKMKKYRIEDALEKGTINPSDMDKFLFAAYNAGEGFVINTLKRNFRGKKNVSWMDVYPTMCSYANIKRFGGLKGAWKRQKEWRERRKMMILPEYVESCSIYKKRFKEVFSEEQIVKMD